MRWFNKNEMIRCYRERKQDRCRECRLVQAASRLPNGIEENIAKVEVNGIEFDVELEKPVAQPKPVVRAVAAPVKTIEAPKEKLEAVGTEK